MATETQIDLVRSEIGDLLEKVLSPELYRLAEMSDGLLIRQGMIEGWITCDRDVSQQQLREEGQELVDIVRGLIHSLD